MHIILEQAYSFHQYGKRDNQEDARFPDSDRPQKEQRFFVVCDGVGGSEKGEVASQTVCKAFGTALSKFDFDESFGNENFSKALDVAYDALDHAVDHDHSDMATTLTFAAFHADGCTLAHIGDSRIYQIRPHKGIIYRSDDHSLVNQMVHSGVITPEEGETHPQRNVIIRCMEPVSVDQNRCMATVTRISDLQAGDYFLLCTDGVLQCFSDTQLVELLANKLSDEQKILAMAKQCEDSDDNNTAYLIRVKDVVQEQTYEYSQECSPSDTKRNVHMQQYMEEIESVKKEDGRNFLSKLYQTIRGYFM